MTNPKVLKLAEALKAAIQAAESIPCIDAGGTCNLDSPEIRLPRWRESDVMQACSLADSRLYANKWTSKPSGTFVFGGFDVPQGVNRTRRVEAFASAIKAAGYDASVHYAID